MVVRHGGERCVVFAGLWPAPFRLPQVDELRLKQVQVEASFSQPNAGMCQNMLSWARSVTGERCGAGLARR